MKVDPNQRLYVTIESVRQTLAPALSTEFVEDFARIEFRNQFTNDRKIARADLTAAVQNERRRREIT